MEITGKYASDEAFARMVDRYLSTFSTDYQIILWGSGKSCKLMIDTIEKTHRIKYIIDKNETLWGKKKYGYELKAPQSLLFEDSKKVKVMIMPFGFVRYDIVSKLRQFGFKNDSYCFGNEYMVLHHYYYNNKLIIQNLGFFIGSACTLKCRDCIAHIPYYTKNKNTFIPFDKIKNDIDKTFSKINFINLITLSTGEIFLHPELNKIIDYFYLYKNRYNYIQTPTNGTIIPNLRILDVMKKCNIGIYISDYSHEIGHKSKIFQLIETCNQHKITYEVFSELQGGKSKIPVWSDTGDFSAPRTRNNDVTAQIFQMCANRAAQVVYDGKLYTCGSAQWGEFGGLYEPVKNSDYIDLSENKLAILRIYFGATDNGYPHVCTRCDGIGPYANTKTIRAGIQL